MGTLLVRVVLGVEEAHGVAVPVDVDETPTGSFNMLPKTCDCAERRMTSHMARSHMASDEAGKGEDGCYDGDVPEDVPRFLLAPKRVGNVLDVALVDRDPAHHYSSLHVDVAISTFVNNATLLDINSSSCLQSHGSRFSSCSFNLERRCAALPCSIIFGRFGTGAVNS
ncbi:hypothetical protein THAOC_21956 [Thalassiosira oceanica]|uniref:Uncharacterized protein n=1 Tax=Thalassiosira oceanica TaxID=159749 RepID=K0RY62_THAOC|nr:hypothetical protein THAOC_21956 [Thalassiosira oceanica]|eukprot:EJK57955.1 hypothetical protein THAOC_21956 [Thalassiosira oceanica]